jgi:hypothetical protein
MTDFMSVDDRFTLEQALMALDMKRRAVERAEGWTVHLIDKWFDPFKLEYPTIMGSFSWTQVSTKTKWIIKKHATDVSGVWQTPGGVARDYLHIKYGNEYRRVTTSQYESTVKTWRSPPLYAVPCELESAVYLDLKSAYWQIVRRGGWDVDYNPGRWLMKQSDVSDFPYPFLKMARNCLVSMGLSAHINMWHDGQLKPFKKGSSFANMVLWSFAQDVLNGFAYDMVRAGAVYVHTDGYIIPADVEPLAYEIADSWGMFLRPKHRGRAIVRNVGNYDIADRETQLKHVNPRYHAKLYNPGNEWLRPRFRTLGVLNNDRLTQSFIEQYTDVEP